MFEKTPPLPTSPHAPADPARFGGSAGVPEAYEEAHLRVIEWNELTARLNAARDLRRVLQRDVSALANGTGSEFADAAARYLHPREEHENDVNLVALEHSKGSSGMTAELNDTNSQSPKQAVNAGPDAGDARED